LLRHGFLADVHIAGGKQKPARAADETEQKVFSKQLAHQPPAACTERSAHGDLRPARDAACELQVGDVGADYEQDKEGGPLDQVEIERRLIPVYVR
jgi:hypothetical protein